LNSHFFIPPPGDLNTLITAFWQIEGRTPFHKEHILPKGIVEVIFNFSNSSPIHAELGGKQYHLSNCFINGFNKVPAQLTLPEQQMFFGIQLQPLAVKKIFGAPAGEFSDLVVDLSLIDPTIHSLWHQLAEQDSFEKRVFVFSDWIKRKLHQPGPQEKMVNDFLLAVDQHGLSVASLANSLCYSTRHLSRKLLEATGMNAEEILLYKKYLHAVHLMHHTDLSLTKIAYQSHFSDQSHFIRAFKNYTNLTPGEYKSSKGIVKGHIYENVRYVQFSA